MLLIHVFVGAFFISILFLIGAAACRSRRRCEELRRDMKKKRLRSKLGF